MIDNTDTLVAQLTHVESDSMFPSAQRHQTIMDIEEMLKDQTFLVDGMDMKPLIRWVLWSEFKRGSRTQTSVRKVVLRSKAGSVVARFPIFPAVQTSTWNRNYWSVSPDMPGTLSKVDPNQELPLGLFAIPKAHVHTSPGSSRVDRVYSPFGRRLRHQTVGLEIESIHRQTIQIGLIAKREVQRLSRLVSACIEASGLTRFFPSDLASMLYWRSRSVLNSRAWSRNLLDRNQQLSYLVLAGWYSPSAMGLTAAFSERNLIVVDIQHGQQGPYQSMYVDWCIHWRPEESLLPSEFWVWGRQTQERISPKTSPYAPMSRIVGYPFLRDMAAWGSSEASRSEEFLNQDQSPRVVVALQGTNIDSGEVIPDELRRFMHTERATFVVRQHPNAPLSRKDKQFLRDEFPNSVEFDDGNRPLPVVLSGADALLTGFSSAVLEAAYMQIPSLVWAPVATDQYSGLVASGVVTADPSQSVTLEEIMRRGKQADWSVLEEYISSSNEDLGNALEVLENAALVNSGS